MSRYGMMLIDKEVAEKLRETDWDLYRKVQNIDHQVFYEKLARTEENLKKALAEVKKEMKIYTRRGFSCCGSCGAYELSEKCKETGKNGYIFYSRQSKDDLSENGQVYFNFGYEKDEDNDAKVARAFCRALKKYGVAFEWDGSPGTCVLVKVS